MAAETLARGGMAVTVVDRMPSLGRKFLLAGRGGLNLTHSEPLEALLARYRPAPAVFLDALRRYPPERLRAWAEALGEQTFVGTSGRVFPRSFKTSPLLRAWLRQLEGLGVQVKLRTAWAGWDADGRPLLQSGDAAPQPEPADVTVLALGGASWPRLGSDGAWAGTLREAGIAVAPLFAANCGVEIAWSPTLARFAGTPLKRIALSFAGERVRGGALITATGLEGGAVYALCGEMRGALAWAGEAELRLDLRPDLTAEELVTRLARPRGKASLSNHLRKTLSLPPEAIALLREAGPVPAEPRDLAARIKAVPLVVTGFAPIGRAISTAGGVSWDALDEHMMLTARPGTFVAGEMLDWDAPTGGYLLQAAFATGAAAAEGALAWRATVSNVPVSGTSGA
jgi:uncharacterized flavoprotein (TIGR03862 family)